jgi:hypothetical protein
MTEDELKQIEFRRRISIVSTAHDTISELSAKHVIERDVPALIKEVRRLQTLNAPRVDTATTSPSPTSALPDR